MSGLLLTGATGFVGQRFVELYGGQQPIVALVRRRAPIGPLHRIYYGDLCSLEDVRAAVRGCSAILHVGGASPNRAYADGHFRATTVGTRNLIQAAKDYGLKRFVFVSSACVHFPQPGPYALSKIHAEEELRRSGLDWTILRPGTILGPRAVDLGRLLRSWRSARLVPMIGDGDYESQPIDVDDVAHACLAALLTPSATRATIEVAGDDIVSFRQFASAFLRELGNPRGRLVSIPESVVRAVARVAERVAPRTGLNLERVRIVTASHRVDTGPMRALLGIHPRPFAEIVKRTVAAGL